ncbi:MAG: 4-hydroxy-tetrahydrodipicolinate synthase [Actinomycetota bacterium]
MEQRPTAPFGRVLTAIITPFDDDGSVDYVTFSRLVNHLVHNGSDGLVVAGTTGESPTLTAAEKSALFRTAVDAAKEKTYIVAGVGTYDTAESCETARMARDGGVDGVMAVTPYYSKPPQSGIIAHMTAIADAAELPMMVYNIPGRTARLIEIDTLVELAGHPRICCVKDAVDDISWSLAALQALPEGFAVYSGSDGMTRQLIEGGAVGVVSVASHFAGVEIAKMVEAVVAGDHDLAKQIDELLAPLVAALFSEPSPMPLKAALTAYWDSVGSPRLPLVDAQPETSRAVGDALTAINRYRGS